jgi:hypothetical protein
MTGPALATTDKASGSRYYTIGGQQYLSVTTILSNGMPKPALIRWAAKEAATYAANNHDELGRLTIESRIEQIKKAPRDKRDKAASRGTALHGICEQILLGNDVIVPLVLQPSIRAFRQFVEDFQPELIAAECTVFNMQHNYAGTLDMICKIGGENWLIDIKTGNGIYPETALQLAAYASADYVALPDGSEDTLPEVHELGVLHLRDDGYRLKQIDTYHGFDPLFQQFLAVKQVAEFATTADPFLHWDITREDVYPNANA